MTKREANIENALTGFNQDLGIDYQIAQRLEATARLSGDKELLARAHQRLAELQQIDFKRAAVTRSQQGRVLL